MIAFSHLQRAVVFAAATALAAIGVVAANPASAVASTAVPTQMQTAGHGGTSLLRPSVTTAAAPATAGCPSPGQRISFDNEPGGIYLVVDDSPGAPDLYWIPSVDVYDSLWDSFSGITTVSGTLRNLCFSVLCELADGYLAKTPINSNVYIYDDCWGGYRWITSADVFTKYSFSWSKIVTQSSQIITPIVTAHPWN
jgi:hypothetical protein